MKAILAASFAVLVLLASSCRTHDYRTVLIHVPAMKNKACADIVIPAVGRMFGVNRESLQVDFGKRNVIVTYDSLLLSLKNIEFAIADVGFQANMVPANAAAEKALPAECR